MHKIQDHTQMSTAHATTSLRDDGVTHVLGPERPDRVRGLGFGATPSKVDACKHYSGMMIEMRAELHNLTQQVNDLRAHILRGGGGEQNLGQSGGDEGSATHAPQATHQVGTIF